VESSTNKTPCDYNTDNTTNICEEFVSVESDLDMKKRQTHPLDRADDP